MRRTIRGAALLAGSVAFTQAGLCLCNSYPQSAVVLPSPNLKFVLNNEDPDAEPHHRLVLLKVGSEGGPGKVLEYDRSIDVCWSPDSRWFIVNEHEGSDSTRPFIFSASDPTVKVDIKKWLVEHWTKRFADTDRGHLYVSADWKDKHTIMVSATGYDDTGRSGFKAHTNLKWKSGQLSLESH